MNTICYPGDAAVIGQSGHRSYDNWTDVQWKDYANVPISYSRHLTHTDTLPIPFPELTGPPVQDLEPGSTVSQEHSVSPRAEGQPPALSSATRHLATPVVQQPQRVSIRTPVLPHRHPSLRRAAEHQRTLRLWRAQETRLSW